MMPNPTKSVMAKLNMRQEMNLMDEDRLLATQQEYNKIDITKMLKIT
jgi:hypothetical protein